MKRGKKTGGRRERKNEQRYRKHFSSNGTASVIKPPTQTGEQEHQVQREDTFNRECGSKG